MKTVRLVSILLMSSIILLMSCGGNNKNNTETNNSKIELKEEIPPLKTNTINAGRLKMHQDGYSIGKKTELTELQKELQNKENDIIEVSWIWDCSPKYDDIPMKIIYNKRDGVLKMIYIQNNVIEEYKNILSECLEEFLKNGEKSFYLLENYCKDAKYDFNNREMKIKATGA